MLMKQLNKQQENIFYLKFNILFEKKKMKKYCVVCIVN
jgi:hypothetical protein